MKITGSFFFALSIVFTNLAFAAPAQPVKKPIQAIKPVQPRPITTPYKPKVEADPGVTFGLDFMARYTAQAEKQADGTRSEYITYEFVPAIKTQDYRIRAIADFVYQVKDQAGNEWENTAIEGTINKPWALGEYFDLKPEILAALPLFRRTTDFNSYVGGRLTVMLKSKNAGIPDLLLRYGLQFGKLNYKNESIKDANGVDVYNIDTRLRQRVHIGYQFTEALSALIYFHYDSNFLYDNSVRNAFYQETLIAYAINSHVTLDMGIANGGGVFSGENQEIDNLKYYNEKSSEAFFSLNLSI